MTACTHDNVTEVGDMPIADPVTHEFLGRFDVTFCLDCESIIAQTQIAEPTPFVPQE